MKKTPLFALITVVLFLVLSELALRLFLSPLPSRPFEWPPADMTRHGLMTDERLFWKLRPNFNGPWGFYKLAYTHELAAKKDIDWETRRAQVAGTYRGVTWEINSDGFRGPKHLGKEEADTCLLLFMGSSITFGWGVRPEQAFPEVVRQELSAAYPGVSFESINAGVPGYSSHQGLRYLEILLPQYSPDVVVAEFGVNDGTIAVGRADKAWEPSILGEMRLWLRNSGWARLVLGLFRPGRDKPLIQDVWQTHDQAQTNFYRISMTGTRTRVAPEDFTANLEAMAAICSKKGVRFFIFIPCLYNEYGRGDLISSVDFQGNQVLPVLEALAAYPKNKRHTLFLPYDEAHLSPRGHRQVGGGLVRFFKNTIGETFTGKMVPPQTNDR